MWFSILMLNISVINLKTYYPQSGLFDIDVHTCIYNAGEKEKTRPSDSSNTGKTDDKGNCKYDMLT